MEHYVSGEDEKGVKGPSAGASSSERGPILVSYSSLSWGGYVRQLVDALYQSPGCHHYHIKLAHAVISAFRSKASLGYRASCSPIHTCMHSHTRSYIFLTEIVHFYVLSKCFYNDWLGLEV